ncbi:hypothetical protein BJX64DRAFT_265213 [Aspergillus heterothallicus]
MPLTTEAIIALVALLVSGPPSILLAWSYYLKRRARRAALSQTPSPHSTTIETVAGFSPLARLARPFRRSPPPQSLEQSLEAGLYTRRTWTNVHLAQMYISLEEVH